MVQAMRLDLNNLPFDIPLLHKLVKDLVQTVALLQDEIGSLQSQLAQLKAKRFGKSSEKLGQKARDDLDQQIEDIENRLEELELQSAPYIMPEDNSDHTFADQFSEQGQDALLAKKQAKRTKIPDHLPRTTVTVHPDPECPSCHGHEFRTLGEDVSEVLEYEPASFKVIRTLRPRCACVNCDLIVQAFPVSNTIDKGKAGPGLLAHVLLQKYGDHLPLYRQSQIYEREGIEIPRSTMAGWVQQCATLLEPLIQSVQAYVFSASHIHGDDIPVPVLRPGAGKTKTGRLWTYVRDGRPYGDLSPPAVCYFYSADRKAKRPEEHLKDFTGVFHADAYAGYNGLYLSDGNPSATILEAACWAHMRRKFYEVTIASPKAQIALSVLQDIAPIYAIEAEIKGFPPEERYAQRQRLSKPLVEALFKKLNHYYCKLPPKGDTAKAIAYALNHQVALQRFLDDGRIQIDNNAAERSLRPVALGRKNWLFAGSDNGGEAAAALYTLIETIKMNNINPWPYLHKVLSIIQDYPILKIHDLLPWNLKPT